MSAPAAAAAPPPSAAAADAALKAPPLRPTSSYAADLWDAPRAQRPEWAVVLAEARALGEGDPAPVQALTDVAAQALLRGGGWDAASVAGRGKASRFPVFLSSTFDGELGPASLSLCDPCPPFIFPTLI